MAKNLNELKHKVLKDRPADEVERIGRRVEEELEQIMAGTMLRELREAAGLTQEGLAERLGHSQAAIADAEKRTDIRLSTLRSIVIALGGHFEIRVTLPRTRLRVYVSRDTIGENVETVLALPSPEDSTVTKHLTWA